jgi:hypothetical protein
VGLEHLRLAIVNIFDHNGAVHEHHTYSVIKCYDFCLHINFILWVLIYDVSVHEKEVEPEGNYVRLVLRDILCVIVLLILFNYLRVIHFFHNDISIFFIGCSFISVPRVLIALVNYCLLLRLHYN